MRRQGIIAQVLFNDQLSLHECMTKVKQGVQQVFTNALRS